MPHSAFAYRCGCGEDSTIAVLPFSRTKIETYLLIHLCKKRITNPKIMVLGRPLENMICEKISPFSFPLDGCVTNNRDLTVGKKCICQLHRSLFKITRKEPTYSFGNNRNLYMRTRFSLIIILTYTDLKNENILSFQSLKVKFTSQHFHPTTLLAGFERKSLFFP